MTTDSVHRSATAPAVVRVEETLRHAGASVLAATGLAAAPWILFAIAYKTYIFVTLGQWYFLGAPTRIGMVNRVALFAILAGIILGAGMLFTAAVLRRNHRQK